MRHGWLYAAALSMMVTGVQAQPPPAPPRSFTLCKDASSLASPDSEFNQFVPLPDALVEDAGMRAPPRRGDLGKFKTTVAQPPQHGTVQALDPPYPYFTVIPERAYEGADQVLFDVQVRDKRYQVLLKLRVTAGQKSESADAVDC